MFIPNEQRLTGTPTTPASKNAPVNSSGTSGHRGRKTPALIPALPPRLSIPHMFCGTDAGAPTARVMPAWANGTGKGQHEDRRVEGPIHLTAGAPFHRTLSAVVERVGRAVGAWGFIGPASWGVAPCWDGHGPLALGAPTCPSGYLAGFGRLSTSSLTDPAMAIT